MNTPPLRWLIVICDSQVNRRRKQTSRSSLIVRSFVLIEWMIELVTLGLAT